jgi:hypothetical protein
MKVKDLFVMIHSNIKEYGKDFLEWDVYTEQISEKQKRAERKTGGSFKDGDEFEYFRCDGFWTTCPRERRFTVNVNY